MSQGFLSWVRIEGTLREVRKLQSKSSGNDYYILKVIGEDDKDCEVVVWGFATSDCANIVEGDYVVIDGKVNIRKREGSQGGTFLNTNIVGNNIRRVTLLPIDKEERDDTTKDEDDLPF